MAEDSQETATVFSTADEAIATALKAGLAADNAYTEAYDDFAATRLNYEKLMGTGTGGPAGLGNIMGMVKKYAPMALKYFGAGGAGAGLLLALAQDGTGSGILSRIGGIFGIGGP